MQKTTFDHGAAAAELRRWILMLGVPALIAALCTAAALAGVGAWLIAPAIVIGPGLGGIALIWLALSSDTNAAHAIAELVEERVPERLAA